MLSLSAVSDSTQTLNVAVLNLDAEWAIEQILPVDEAFLTLGPKQEKIIPLNSSLDGKDDSVEIPSRFLELWTQQTTEFWSCHL